MHLCEVCGEPIEGKLMRLYSLYYHRGCYFPGMALAGVLCEACGEPIDDQHMVIERDLYFHRLCFNIVHKWLDIISLSVL